MAKSGYGKRAVGDEDPHADPDFAHLSQRDREIAVFVDHLEDGHAMGYKVIAAEHPRYGQQATRVSLGVLVVVGHLRWIKEHITAEDGSMRWVTRTYWSRTRRSPQWWADFARARDGKDVTAHYQPGLARVEELPGAAEDEPEPAPQPEQPEQPESDEEAAEQPSAAYLALAELRAFDARMSLSDRDCRALESLAAEWLACGATTYDLAKALTDGLPPAVTNPGGLARNRLESKMPPKKAKVRQKAAPARARVTRVIMACGLCDADERTAEIVDGLCRECRAEIELEIQGAAPMPVVPETFLSGPAPDVVDVTRWAAEVRAAGGLRSRAGRRM
ncbi:hypothetical protein ACFY1U_15430 [Streptomyces sp. NPDC001351]|uniref:hypothetical protein n=1 Tax=Streptomyces sp. NPDC001351 TaxID=3364564 RepID=UPI00367F89E8